MWQTATEVLHFFKGYSQSLQVVIVLEVPQRTYARTLAIVDSPVEDILSRFVLIQL